MMCLIDDWRMGMESMVDLGGGVCLEFLGFVGVFLVRGMLWG